MNVQDLKDLVSVVDGLEQQVAGIINAPLPFDRAVPFYPAEAASWIVPDTGLQEVTWLNTGGDFYLCSLGWAAWASLPANALYTGSPATTLRLVDMGVGLGVSVQNDDDVVSMYPRFFDFQWNVRRRSSAASFGAPTGGTGLLSRSVLGNMDRGRPLTFRTPWHVPMGDGLIFSLRPNGYGFDPSWAASRTRSARFTVHMIMHGFRTGVR